MYLLQATETTWYSPVLSAILILIVFALIAFFIMSKIVSSVREQRRQTRITHQLLAELLKVQGVSDEKIRTVLRSK